MNQEFASRQHSTVPVDSPQHHADLRAHRHHRGIGFGRNEPRHRPEPQLLPARADRNTSGARHGIYHAPARTEAAPDR